MNSNIYNKYDQSTLSKFDIIGSYFVNLYYNEFYIKSKNLKFDNMYSNITDAYKNVLSSYLEFTKKSEFFKQIIKGIHTYCISTTRYTTMTHKECIDFMVYEFVPSNLWNSLRESQKNKLFHESITNCITIFTEKIISNHLHIIIDHRDQPENITILQDLFLSIILFEKDKIFSKFLNPNSKDSNNLEVFRDKLKSIVNEKKQLHDENKTLSNKISLLDNLVKKNVDIITELQKNNKLLIKKLELYKVDNIRLKLLTSKYIKSTSNIKPILSKSNTETVKTTNETVKSNNLNNKSDIESVKSVKSDIESVKSVKLDNLDIESVKSDNLDIESYNLDIESYNLDSETYNLDNDSDNESVKSNENYLEISNRQSNKNLSQFIQKRNNESIPKITSELIFHTENIDEYDQ
jgi:hypothetical protein